MPFFDYLIFLGIFLPLLPLLVQWAVFRLVRIQVNKVSFLAGKPIKTFFLGKTTVTIGWIPTYSHIEYDIAEFNTKGLPIRLGILLVGAAACFALASALLGAPLAWHHCWTGLSQLWQGGLHPQTVAPMLIGKLQETFSNSFAATAGIVTCKLIAFAFLPLGGMTTLQLIRQVLDPFDRKKALTYFFGVSATLGFVLYYFWIVMAILVASGLMAPN